MSAHLTLVAESEPKPPPKVTTVPLPAEAARYVADLSAKAVAVDAIFRRPFTTAANMERADALLAEIETAAKLARAALRRAR